jgi:enoyl-CoA hydratase/carnithine racemase
MPGGGLTVRLPDLIGRGSARRMSFTREVIDAQQAHGLGLVTEVVPHEQLWDRAGELAQRIAEVPLREMVELKRIYEQSARQPMGAALQAEISSSRRWRTDFDDFVTRRDAVVVGSRRQLGQP